MATGLTDQQLMEFSREHLMHEMTMLWETENALRQHKQGTVEYVALLESFATHLRNLIEFFYDRPSKEYVRAKHFFDNPSGWSQRRSPAINELYARACNEVTHLTTARISGNPPEKEWHTGNALTLVDTVAKEFAATASPSKLHPEVLEFLKVPAGAVMAWIGKNISHTSNVSSQVVTVLGGFSASTATVIRGTLTLKTP